MELLLCTDAGGTWWISPGHGTLIPMMYTCMAHAHAGCPPSFHRTYLGGRLEEQADGGRAGALGKGTIREKAKGQERTADEHDLLGGVLEGAGLSW